MTRNITEHNITDAVVARFENCPDARLKEILTALVRHLHGFVRETQITEAEWLQGIRFLTDTGHITDGKRQEYILLSDVLGVSMLTVAMNHAKPKGATEATVFGPFHVPGAPHLEQGADMSNGAPGQPLEVNATVRGLDGEPVAGATVDVWQADDDGFYDVQRPELSGMRARAVFTTDARGRLRFRTVLPVAYPVPTDGPVGRMLVASGRHPWRPAHVHFMIQAPGYETLITHVFRAGDPYLDSDVVFGVRESLVAEFVARREPEGTHHTLDFDFVLNRAAG
jgi:hydroxyquinol 1,2-dioxygenase